MDGFDAIGGGKGEDFLDGGEDEVRDLLNGGRLEKDRFLDEGRLRFDDIVDFEEGLDEIIGEYPWIADEDADASPDTDLGVDPNSPEATFADSLGDWF